MGNRRAWRTVRRWSPPRPVTSNRLGTGANVYLASAELAAVASLLGRLPTPDEYQTYMAQVDKTAADTYRYLNFDQLGQYTEKADGVIFQTAV